MKKVKTLFIDPSVNNVGYAIYDGATQSIVDYGCHKTKGDNIQTKLEDIFFFISEIVKDNLITFSVIEQPAVFAYSKVTAKSGKILNLSALQKLSMAVGCIVGSLALNNIKVDLIPANKWKGRMAKSEVRSITKIKNEHAADAYLMAVLYYNLKINKKEVVTK